MNAEDKEQWCSKIINKLDDFIDRYNGKCDLANLYI